MTREDAIDVAQSVRAELVVLRDQREALALAAQSTEAVDAQIAALAARRAAVKARVLDEQGRVR